MAQVAWFTTATSSNYETMDNKLLVTFIMPAYNVEDYIRESIESVLAQTYKDWRLIVIDDCSTDSTSAIVAEYAERNPKITLMRTPAQTGACYMPRKIGIMAADTELIAPLDADDWIDSCYLENLIRTMRDFNADIVYPTMFVQTSRGMRALMAEEMCGHAESGDSFIKYTLDGWKINCNGGVLRKELYTKGFEKFDLSQLKEYYFPDEIQTRQLLHDAATVVFSHEPYYYRYNEDSLSNRLTPSKFSPLNNARILRGYIREWFGYDSEEASLAESGLLHHAVSAIRLLRGKNLDEETRRIGVRILEESYDSIDWQLARPNVSKLYWHTMRAGLPMAKKIFMIIDKIRRR